MTNIIPVNVIFPITAGEFDDYRIIGIFKALQDLDVEFIRQNWLKRYPDSNNYFDHYEFLKTAIKDGLIEPIEMYNFHLHNYSDISEMEILYYKKWEPLN